MAMVHRRFVIAGLVALSLHGLVLSWTMSEVSRHSPDLSLERIEVSLGSAALAQPVQKRQDVKKSVLPQVQQKIKPVELVPSKPLSPNPPPVAASIHKQVAVAPPQRIPVPALDSPVTPPSFEAVAQPLHKAVPLYQINPPPKYPRIARRRGLQGVVLLDVQVNSTGCVEEVRLSRSSSHGVLDKAALKAVRSWRFNVGTVGGVPTSMWVKVPVRFMLH